MYRYRWGLAHKINYRARVLQISHHDMERLCALFVGVSKRFVRFRGHVECTRKNFVSYDLFCRHAFTALGLHEQVTFFTDLKSSCLTKEHDRILKQLLVNSNIFRHVNIFSYIDCHFCCDFNVHAYYNVCGFRVHIPYSDFVAACVLVSLHECHWS